MMDYVKTCMSECMANNKWMMMAMMGLCPLIIVSHSWHDFPSPSIYTKSRFFGRSLSRNTQEHDAFTWNFFPQNPSHSMILCHFFSCCCWPPPTPPTSLHASEMAIVHFLVKLLILKRPFFAPWPSPIQCCAVCRLPLHLVSQFPACANAKQQQMDGMNACRTIVFPSHYDVYEFVSRQLLIVNNNPKVKNDKRRKSMGMGKRQHGNLRDRTFMCNSWAEGNMNGMAIDWPMRTTSVKSPPKL